MKMKKLTGIVLAAACMVSLAGCGSSEKKEVNVEKPEDLKTLTIGVQQGTTGDILSSDQVEKDSQMKRYPKGSTAIQALKNGKIDCVVIDSEPAAKFGEKNQDLKIIDGVFETEEYAMCVKKGNTELLDEMNKALEELKEDGTVDKIIGNYIGDDTGKYQYESPADVDHSKGTLVMATNAEFEPYEYHEGDGIVGIDVDLSRAICDKMGYDLEILDMEFDSILPSIAAGKAAAANIDEYLGYHHIITADVEIPKPRLDDRTPCGRVNMTEREVCERVCDFEGVENCMTEQEAKQEANRCLRCDHFGLGVFKGGRKTVW